MLPPVLSQTPSKSRASNIIGVMIPLLLLVLVLLISPPRTSGTTLHTDSSKTSVCPDCIYHDYCVVGAGPSGLQIGYFLQQAGRDYIVFEKASNPGSFYEVFPRHRKLISINKRHTGKLNVEFNMRHDWNSLLSHDETLRMTRYSKQMFPHAQVLVDYLADFQRKLNISVKFNTKIKGVRTEPDPSMPDGHLHLMEDQKGQQYSCRALIMATGMSKPNIPKMEGIKYAQGYESISTNPEDYEGKTVLILGRGNSAFEVADCIYGSTNLIHMVASSRVRLAWATHYVGDLRAVNNGLLDTYQLKSLDALAEIGRIERLSLRKEGDKIYFVHKSHRPKNVDNSAFREPYDIVIRALGFTFDETIFANGTSALSRGKKRAKKYPAIHHNYESIDTKGLFIAGTASHSLDFRKSAGGFIHGFRYTARALHRLLDWRYESVPWPSATFPRSDLLNTIVKRINEASGTYQMFQVLGDVAVLSQDGSEATYIEDFPVHLLHELPQHTGISAKGPVLVVLMEYGRNFSGSGNDVFRPDRANTEPFEADVSNFLHPVLYYYKTLPSALSMESRGEGDILPEPDKIHHIVEDFLTRFDASHAHILTLRRFLEHSWGTDQRNFFSGSCFHIAMTNSEVPESCRDGYLQGMGLPGTKELTSAAASYGLI